jgi:hypothetical protein
MRPSADGAKEHLTRPITSDTPASSKRARNSKITSITYTTQNIGLGGSAASEA